MKDIDAILAKLDATEANIAKLESIWRKMQKHFPNRPDADKDSYDKLHRHFQRIVGSLPTIDGYEFKECLWDFDSLYQAYVSSGDIDEPEALASFEIDIHRQGATIAEYRFRYDTMRKKLLHGSIMKLSQTIRSEIERINTLSVGYEFSQKIDRDEWMSISASYDALDTMLGSSTKRPKAWHDMQRHIGFGERNDIENIRDEDWPRIEPFLNRVFVGDLDPIPVDASDLNELEGSTITETPSKLQWGRLSAEDFERLVFSIVSSAEGYENPQWLTRTNAADKGRDVSVFRVLSDSLSDQTRLRVFIACKHYTKKSINDSEIESLRAQMRLWDGPRVDVLVIASSGRFTTNAVEYVDRHNEGNDVLRIEMWPESHIERLLARRPDLIASFNLR